LFGEKDRILKKMSPESTNKILNSPSKPVVIFDGDCTFCRKWIRDWQSDLKEWVDFIPYQEGASRFKEIPLENFQKAVHLITPEGKVFSGAHAVFQMMAQKPRKKWMLWLYLNLPGMKGISEWCYKVVADHRPFFSWWTGIIWGNYVGKSQYLIAQWVFLRGLGIIYLIAFGSLWVQIIGLVGSDGILPTESFLKAVTNQLGLEQYRVVPTVFWMSGSDLSLHLVCLLGVVMSFLLIIDIAPILSVVLLWGLYLSLLSICRVFLSFQWDILLLEAGFLAIFLAPFKLKPGLRRESLPSPTVIWLFKWLLFRLTFASGMVKLASGDATWKNLTALNFHYETQPIPSWTSWYAHRLPEGFQKFSTFTMFLIELLIPFLIFAPRRIRIFSCVVMVGFQLSIVATGNYCFFNYLTILLCIFLIDDSIWPKSLSKKISDMRSWNPNMPSGRWSKWIVGPLAFFVVVLTTVPFINRIGGRVPWPSPIVKAVIYFSPIRSFNSYGLFAVMTTERPEIIVEGSNDGKDWKPYGFKWKPGNLSQRPRFVAPHQPRLDWQMWFAALGDYRRNPWFINFCYKLLQGSKPVLSLLAHNPFPEAPPKYLKATVYNYWFTNFKEKKDSGNWWKREIKGLYCPVLTIQNGQLTAVQ